MVLLRGNLRIKIIGCKNLPNFDGVRGSLGKAFSKVTKDLSDPYVRGFIGKNRLFKTAVIHNNLNPVYNVEYNVVFSGECDFLKIEVVDLDLAGDDKMGEVLISGSDLQTGKLIGGAHDIIANKAGKKHGTIEMEVQYVHLDERTLTAQVPDLYFDAWNGCNVHLYQDAFNFEGELPPVKLGNGQEYVHRSLWRDIYKSINDAKHFIYICGWSVWTELVLIRDVPESEQVTLGQMLKRKAEEGVVVNVMVWDDASSITNRFFELTGMMATHDEETKKFFHGSKVNCVLAPRSGGKANSMLEAQGVKGVFTHHQKNVICDAPTADAAQRRVVAYIGGIDLTDGRFDSPSHPLFRTLKTYHKSPDFVQNCVAGVDSKVGPREGWHDIHAYVEGHAAWDIMANFTERWLKQAGRHAQEKLCNIGGIGGLIPADKDTFPDDKEQFMAQIIRSIDSRSAEFSLLDRVKHLFSKKGRHIDDSIHKAYIHQIRRAKNNIYIENQYFLGSCQEWDSHQNVGCTHLVPLELAYKICDKIRNKEDFAAYIVIPMFPEGNPADGAVQAILAWQFNTIKMMYHRIGKALQEVGSTRHPCEYLMFFCLANRETQEGSQSNDKPAPGTPNETVWQTRRVPIYVHSKLMIVDDEYVIIGSANINQRSMGATRDSEICIGAFQPGYMIKEDGVLPKGQVYGFRQSLFAEHFGPELDPAWENPGSAECVKSIRDRAAKNWELYTADAPVEMTSHGIPYPYEVLPDGNIKSLDKFPCFVDTKAPVVGTVSSSLPNILTT